MFCRTKLKALAGVLVCIAIVNNSTYALEDRSYKSPMCRTMDFKCKFCDNHELDCSSTEIADGMLTSPMFPLSTFVPNNTTIINLSGNSLTYLSIDYADMWINGLKELFLSHNSIQIIYTDSFNGLSSLEILDMSYNQIRFLQSDVFEHLRGLQTLDLSHNFLSRIDGFWFQGPRNLIRLNLSYNTLGNLIN